MIIILGSHVDMHRYRSSVINSYIALIHGAILMQYKMVAWGVLTFVTLKDRSQTNPTMHKLATER